jgi:hypothetical protein
MVHLVPFSTAVSKWFLKMLEVTSGMNCAIFHGCFKMVFKNVGSYFWDEVKY